MMAAWAAADFTALWLTPLIGALVVVVPRSRLVEQTNQVCILFN